MPGVTGTFFSIQYFTVLGFKPGLTMNFAPAATAASTCSAFRTVPAPTHISGKFVVIIRIASAAALVRKVTSAQGSPPAHNAFARGSASSALSIFTTGTIPILLICSKTAFIFPLFRMPAHAFLFTSHPSTFYLLPDYTESLHFKRVPQTS